MYHRFELLRVTLHLRHRLALSTAGIAVGAARSRGQGSIRRMLNRHLLRLRLLLLLLVRIGHDDQSLRKGGTRFLCGWFAGRRCLLLVPVRLRRVLVSNLSSCSALLDLLEVATQSIAASRLDNGRRLAGHLRLLFIIVRAGIAIVLAAFLLPLFAPVDVVLQLDAHLAFRRLLPDERVLQ